MKRVVITGMGLATSIGWSRDQVLAALMLQRTGIEKWDPLPGVSLPIPLAGTVKGFNTTSPDPFGWTFPDNYSPDQSLLRALPPHGAYALWAITQMLADAGLEKEDLHDGATGLFCASAGSPRNLKMRLDELERSQYRRAHPLGVVSSISGLLNFQFSAWLGITGPSCGFVSACASGSHALGFAWDEITLGRAQRMLVVAGEDLTVETVMPFHGMGALSREAAPENASCPFDQRRTGFVPSGGAVALMLEEESSARERGAVIRAGMDGWAQSTDGFHCAQPHPEGRGLRQAMQLALQSAEKNAADIDYINAHATSTPAGDAAEALAIAHVFAGHQPPVSSTKALTGHPLSLSGLLEAAVCILALEEKFIPGQAHLHEAAPEARTLNLPKQNLATAPRTVLNNTCGFGGANVSHIFSHA